jgi:threonine/homoserine/homoserine lactone efflux protein
MHFIAPLLAIVGIHLLAVASPGPAFVATLRVAAGGPRRSAVLHAMGLALGAFTWAVGAMAGLQAVMVKAVWLYRFVELAGGLYLVYIGIQGWRHADSPLPTADSGAEVLSAWDAVRRGYLLNIANPKVVVFFASIFAAMLPPAMPLWVKLVTLIVIAFDEGLWYSMLALLFSTPRAQTVYRSAKRTIDRVAGSFMLVFGGKLSWNAVRG